MDDNIFDKLKKLTGQIPDKLNILEEQIDIDVQMEYFKYSKKMKKATPTSIDDIPKLTDKNLSIDDKKRIIIQISNIDDPKAFKLLKSFSKKAPDELKDWTTLALQESRMLLESSLLDENQIYISTGLGGKDNMLRYFIVLIGKKPEVFEDFQKNIISSEFEFTLKKNKCIFEEITFQENFASFTALIPFELSFQKIFKSTIAECNQYGDFLKSNFIVTNVKRLSIQEIKDIINKKNIPLNKNIELDKLDDYEE
jgi:hypothetical protein